MNNRQCYFIYPRDKRGKLTGHYICVMVHEGKIFHGMALCSVNDSFNKETGRKLAHERALKSIEKHKTKKEGLLSKLMNHIKGA